MLFCLYKKNVVSVPWAVAVTLDLVGLQELTILEMLAVRLATTRKDALT